MTHPKEHSENGTSERILRDETPVIESRYDESFYTQSFSEDDSSVQLEDATVREIGDRISFRTTERISSAFVSDTYESSYGVSLFGGKDERFLSPLLKSRRNEAAGEAVGKFLGKGIKKTVKFYIALPKPDPTFLSKKWAAPIVDTALDTNTKMMERAFGEVGATLPHAAENADRIERNIAIILRAFVSNITRINMFHFR
ncbi:MAG: hypothetical protein ACE37M_07885 [Henriciella sp.]